MAGVSVYLEEKRRAVAARSERIARGEVAPVALAARATVEGRSGVRRIGIRRHAIITDSLPDFAGDDLGPGSPELQLGVLASCLAHTVLIQAALTDVPITSLAVDVTASFDARAGSKGFEDVPVHPQDIAYEIHIGSPAEPATLRDLEARVARACPILNLLRLPQTVSGHLVRGDRDDSTDPTAKETRP
jgi:uncharacterized OsmC-like protein